MTKSRWLVVCAVLWSGPCLADMSDQDFRALQSIKGYDLSTKAGREQMLRDFARKAQSDPGSLARQGILRDAASRNDQSPFKPASKDGNGSDPCAGLQNLFVRRDKLDISSYNFKIPTSDAKGAAFTYTDDRITGTQTAEVHGVASYVISRPCVPPPPGIGNQAYVAGFTLAPFVSANGTLSSVQSSEKSALQGGFDAQIGIFGGLFNYQSVTLSPYYQTDFRGIASAYGMTATWQPYYLPIKLGGGHPRPALSALDFDWYWVAKAEADTVRVDNPGLTDLKANTNYSWLGGEVQIYMFPFYTQLDGRLSVIAGYKYLWEAQGQKDVRLFTGSIGYNITSDGATSVSLEYQNGTDKNTLKDVNKYLMTLNYKN